MRHIGVSNFSVEQMQRVEKIVSVETLEPPYSLVHPNAENACILHLAVPSLQDTFLSSRALILWCLKHDFLISGFVQEQRQGSTSFLNRSSRVETGDFPRRVQQFITVHRSNGFLALALCREGSI
ncbi:MAG TPA: hypothetical protein VHZ51_03120 [Ktedonobacteraceae bacterium]|nr:hypothetical protein [Ktedonobacteraceae bacterium]